MSFHARVPLSSGSREQTYLDEQKEGRRRHITYISKGVVPGRTTHDVSTRDEGRRRNINGDDTTKYDDRKKAASEDERRKKKKERR